MKVGFLGFGEAASAIAEGLKQSGDIEILAYDVVHGPKTRERLWRIQQDALCTLPELGTCDVVFSAVTASTAVTAAESVAPHLGRETLYVDLNSCSPRTKARVAAVVSESGAQVVGVAVMSAVKPHKHRVPMLADGPAAATFREMMLPYGMCIEVVDGPVGASAAIKMFRSAIVKGLEALAIEALVPAYKMGVASTVLKSLHDSFGSMDLAEVVQYLLARHAEHSERRAHEMQEVADTIRECGIDPSATQGCVQRLSWSAVHGVSEALHHGERPEYTSVLAELSRHLP
jgi:3-hydroxyisobutyrate dehydrogenase-like beta-hydroxyacid dehydrogenase